MDHATPDRPLGFACFEPRLRLVIAALAAVVIVSLDQFPPLMTALGIAVGMILASRLPLGQTLKRICLMDGFIIGMLVILPFSVPGSTAFTLFGFVASWEGLAQTALIALKANAVLLVLLSLVATMAPNRLANALGGMKVPATLVHLLLFTTRYIHVIGAEYQRLRRAMRARGFQPGTNWHSYRSFGHLIGMVLVRALERSERVLAAMKCRGFDGRLHLTAPDPLLARDYGFGLVSTGLLIGLLLWNFLPGSLG
ncbi:MAG: cobalt ECF transporter T component CbiQ [Rhodospirillaceae bacterium]